MDIENDSFTDIMVGADGKVETTSVNEAVETASVKVDSESVILGEYMKKRSVKELEELVQRIKAFCIDYKTNYPLTLSLKYEYKEDICSEVENWLKSRFEKESIKFYNIPAYGYFKLSWSL
jgi:hypothetical protein